jgi:hypothetical protein
VFYMMFRITINNFLQNHYECVDVMEKEVCSLGGGHSIRKQYFDKFHHTLSHFSSMPNRSRKASSVRFYLVSLLIVLFVKVSTHTHTHTHTHIYIYIHI